LRARPDDILPLAFHFGVAITSELKRAFFAGFDAPAEAALLRHAWPGNVRELRNTVERSVYRAADPDAPLAAILFDPFATPYTNDTEPGLAPPLGHDERLSDSSLPDDFKGAIAAFERRLLRRGLERAQFNQRATAELLGLTYHQLRGLLRKHGHALSPRRE